MTKLLLSFLLFFSITITFIKNKAYSQQVAPSPFEALLKQATEGDEEAQVDLGNVYYNGDIAYEIKANKEQAVYWYRKAAEQGYSEGQYNLAVSYDDGIGIKTNKEQAAYWYRKAAEQGNGKAQYQLGDCYANGEGVAKSIPDAIYWYRKAAEQGNGKAQRVLTTIEY